MLARGGTAWLIGHEMRLVWRDGGRAGRIMRILAVALLLALPVLGGIALGFYLRGLPADPRDLYGFVSAGWAGLVLLMLSGAALHVLRIFHDRADFDLLLASPLPPARILAAKAVAVQLTVALPMLVLTTPFLVTMAWFGHPGWLGGTAMVAIAAVIATGLAFVLASRLLVWLGSRRARLVLQLMSGVIGLTVGLGGQAANVVPETWAVLIGWLRTPPPPPWDAAARAVFGEPAALLLFLCLAGIAALASAHMAAAQLEAGRHEPQAQHRAARFGGAPARVLLVKELRLLGRDPELLATVLLQLAYLIPAFGLIFIGGTISPARLAAAVVLLTGMVAASLGWIVICGEDAPDLVAAAPLPAAQVQRVKLAAACLPPLALAAPLLAGVALLDGRAAAIGLGVAPLAALAGALLQGWAAKPLPRKAFRARQRGSILLALTEYALAGAWSAVVTLTYAGSPWVAAPLLLAALVLDIARATRPR